METRILKKIKQFNDFRTTLYIPQFFRKPVKFFGITFIEGEWVPIKIGIECDYYVNTLQEAEFEINEFLAKTKHEYIKYP